MLKYRFYKFLNNQKWFVYGRGIFTLKLKEAALFTDLDWIQWAEAEGLEREKVGAAAPQGGDRCRREAWVEAE